MKALKFVSALSLLCGVLTLSSCLGEGGNTLSVYTTGSIYKTNTGTSYMYLDRTGLSVTSSELQSEDWEEGDRLLATTTIDFDNQGTQVSNYIYNAHFCLCEIRGRKRQCRFVGTGSAQNVRLRDQNRYPLSCLQQREYQGVEELGLHLVQAAAISGQYRHQCGRKIPGSQFELLDRWQRQDQQILLVHLQPARDFELKPKESNFYF